MAVYRPRCRVSMRVMLDPLGGPIGQPLWLEGKVPLDASVHNDKPSDPDEFRIKLHKHQFPFDPEQIKATSCSVYMWDSDGSPGDENKLTKDRLQITGLTAEPVLTRGASSTDTFELVGKDYLTILQRRWPPVIFGTESPKLVPVGKPLDQTIQNLVDEATRFVPGGGGIAGAVLRGTLHAMDIVASYQRLTVVWKVRGAPPPMVIGTGTKKRGFRTEDESTYWSIIVWLCAQYGYTVQLRDLEVWITAEHELDLSDARQLAVGRNVSTLEIGRGLMREQVAQVVVQSHDPKTRQPVEAKFPEKAYDGQEPIVEPWHGLTQAQAAKVAQRIYHARGRNEAKVRVVTKHLADLDGQSLVGLRHGDPILVTLDPPAELEMRTMNQAQRLSYMLGHGYGRTVAEEVAQNYERLRQARRPYFVKGTSKEFSSKSGFSLEISARNYVFVERDDVAA